jgi:hypothetical protein
MSLYRFSEKRYLDDFIQGRLSFAMASSYEDVKLTDAQRDDEQARTFNPDIKKHAFAINGMPIKALKDVEIKHTARDSAGERLNYYLMSFTIDYDERLYEEFKADSCIEIFNEDEFKSRLNKALDTIGWKGLLGAVEYYDPQRLGAISTNEDILFSKADSYAWQKEFRIAIFPFSQEEIKEQRKIVDIGDLSDVAKFIK